MPRILSVWLDRWPIRRFLQAQSRKPAAEPVDPARPFVLALDASGGPKVAALNDAARAEGIAAGERIADARAKARGGRSGRGRGGGGGRRAKAPRQPKSRCRGATPPRALGNALHARG